MRRYLSLCILLIVFVLVANLAFASSDKESDYTLETTADLSLSRVQKSELELSIVRMVRIKGELRVTHSLRWLGSGPSWRLSPLVTFHYHFLDQNKNHLRSSKESIILNEEFQAGKRKEWSNIAQVEIPGNARWISVEFGGTEIFTKPVPIRDAP
jgi:hypothetical protein